MVHKTKAVVDFGAQILHHSSVRTGLGITAQLGTHRNTAGGSLDAWTLVLRVSRALAIQKQSGDHTGCAGPRILTALPLALGWWWPSGFAWSPDLHSVTTTLQSTVQNPRLTNPKEFDSDSNRVT